jgi:hypothetical protein
MRLIQQFLAARQSKATLAEYVACAGAREDDGKDIYGSMYARIVHNSLCMTEKILVTGRDETMKHQPALASTYETPLGLLGMRIINFVRSI